MKRMPRWIFLSPHLDDAPLSVGGLIAALGSLARVEVWTLFCGASFQGPYSELAQWLHESSGGPTGSRLSWQREREDRGACRLLGAQPKHFPWKDSPYRKTGEGEFMYNGDACTTWHAADDPLIESIAANLMKSFQDGDVVVAPLAIGNHVDHLITRRAAEIANPASLLYYAEVPYVVTYKEQVSPKTERLCAIDYTLRASDVDDWLGAVRCYVTQMRMLEKSVGPVPQMIHQYATATGLRLYRPSDRPGPDLSQFGFFRSSAEMKA